MNDIDLPTAYISVTITRRQIAKKKQSLVAYSDRYRIYYLRKILEIMFIFKLLEFLASIYYRIIIDIEIISQPLNFSNG